MWSREEDERLGEVEGDECLWWQMRTVILTGKAVEEVSGNEIRYPDREDINDHQQ
jgi:hypothetical protein